MKKLIILTFLLGAVNFVLINQVIIPFLGCGSTIGEGVSAFGLLLLIIADYEAAKYIIKKLNQNYKNNEDN